MKTRLLLTTMLVLTTLGHQGTVEAQALNAEQLADHGLPAGPAREVLPGSGALIHLQLHDLLGVIEGVEEILVAGIPEKAAPPDVQNLLKTEHPLLTALGMQTLQQPLSAESIAEATGIDTRETVGLTLYLGDPRRMFILSLPTRMRQPLAYLLNDALQPSEVEEVSVSGQKALRVVSQQLHFLPELYLVSSSDTMYLCGDRSLVQALHHTPAAQRFGQDPFLSRALPAAGDQQIRLILNPAMAKPLALQLQGIRMLAKHMIPQQRAELLKKLPEEAKERIEMQVRMQLGIQDIEELADYAECIVVATMEQVVDFVSSRMIAFEGFTMGASLQDGVVAFQTGLHSNRFQGETCTQPLPMDQIKQALAWLGSDYQSFSVTGKKPQAKQAPIISDWSKRVQQQCESKGLVWGGLNRFIELLDALKPVPTVESRAPWVLSTYAPLHPAPSLAKAESLEDYFISLKLPVYRPVKVTPDQGRHFLANCFQEETEALNTNRELGQEFANTLQKQRPWFLQENRFRMDSSKKGITRYTRESTWTTRSGLFGYDQHELVNRKVVHARRVGDYLVYHRGALSSSWLGDLKAGSSGKMAPGVLSLLDLVPEGANYISVQRFLQGLPQWVGWIAALEDRLFADVETYVEKAQAIADDTNDLEKAKKKISKLKMPWMVGSVHIRPDSKEVYALLPTGNMPLILPRPKLVPLLQELLVGYAEQADSVGGSLVYTKVGDGSCQFAVMQSTAALTTLTKTFGNALFENYLAGEEQLGQLQRKVSTQHDGNPKAFDEVIARNPQWAFIPQPKPKVPAKPSKRIPERSVEADKQMIDLSDHYNGALNETWQKGGMSNNTLRDLPRGIETLDGVTFDIRGIVQLSGQGAVRDLRVKFPEEVSDIRVRQQARKIHFLHSCGWPSGHGETIGYYVIHYANGETRKIPIIYGEDVTDWWLNAEAASGSKPNVVWQGKNHAAPDGPSLGICKTTWKNPLPDVKIVRIDYRSTMKDSAPFLIAISVE